MYFSRVIMRLFKETLTTKILHGVSTTSCHHCQMWRKRRYVYRNGMCVSYKNVNNEMIARDCSNRELRANRVTLRLGLFFLIKSISKISHLSLLRHFLRILKIARRFDDLKLCSCLKFLLITKCLCSTIQ